MYIVIGYQQWNISMTDRMAKVQDHWTLKGVLERINAVLAELGHNPK